MYIGIDVGGTAIKAGIVDDNCNIIVKSSIKTRAKESYKILAEDICEIAQKLVDESGYKMSDMKAMGVGCPGSVDDKGGIVVYANNLNLINAPLAEAIKEIINIPVFLGNDANCAALGEFFALCDDKIQNVVAITLGTGVGGGVIINRKLYTGFNGSAGELGHIVLKADGMECTCGRKGCWEAYASVTALIGQAEEAAKENPKSLLFKYIEDNGGKANGKIPFDAAEKGDKTAKDVVDKYIRYVSEGIVDVINVFQPEALIIGGGISKQGENLVAPIREYVKNYTYGHQCNIPVAKISIAKLGNDAGIVGAALLGK